MRTNKIIAIVGTRNTGKTDFTKNLIDEFPQPKKIIVDVLDNPVWHNLKTHNHPEWESRKVPAMPLEKLPYHKSGMYRVFSSDMKYLEKTISEEVANCLVVFEDATRWFKPNLTDAQLRYLLNSKQLNCDVVLVFHNLRKVPRDVVSNADFLVLLKTGESTYDQDKYYHPGFAQAFKEVHESEDRYIHRIIQLQ